MVDEIKTQTKAAEREAIARKEKAREKEAEKKATEQQKEREDFAKSMGVSLEDLEKTDKSTENLIDTIYSEKAKEAERTGKGKGILEMIGLKKTAIEKAQSEKKKMSEGLDYMVGRKKFKIEYIERIRPKYGTLDKLLKEHEGLTKEIEKVTPSEKVEKFKQLKNLENRISEFLKFVAKNPEVSRYGYNAEKGEYEDRTKYE